MKWFRWVWLAGTLALLGEAFYQAMYVAPVEATMGNIYRIFYYHVPAAWVTFLFFLINLVASIVYLAVRHRDPLRAMGADALALASAEVGVLFCTAVLMMGMLWARPVWGIWWTWDARLTSTFAMWLIYCSYLLRRRGRRCRRWRRRWRSSAMRMCRSSTFPRAGGGPSTRHQ
jgi:heme exporter protein C